MPTYSYKSRDGKHFLQRYFPIGTAPARLREGRRVFVRDIAADFCGVSSCPSTTGEIRSRSMAVLPAQAAEAQAVADSLGCRGVTYSKDGVPVFSGSAAKREFQLKHGFANYDPGYRDVTPDDVRQYRAHRGELTPVGEWPE
jgi:hypothetical protein